jgi:hypothetical protein
LVGFFVVATGVGAWAAYSYSNAVVLLNAATTEELSDPVLQMSNSEAKEDRLAVMIPSMDSGNFATSAAAPAPSYSVAALNSAAAELSKPHAEPRKPAAASPDKTKRVDRQKLLLDDAQIASLRTRLKLTPTQEEFWPAVEVTLRDVIRAHARKSRKSHPHGVAPQIDVNSAEVQQLISAAMPLIVRLSEEQKREVRALARIIGLETVASKI